MQSTNHNKEVDALNEALVGGSKRAAYYGGLVAAGVFLFLFFAAVLDRFLDTGAPSYLIPSVLWGAVAYFGIKAIWSRIKP
ncbi:MAG: hypothetical protein ABJF50_14950 [Paracoccaceae bacterium]